MSKKLTKQKLEVGAQEVVRNQATSGIIAEIAPLRTGLEHAYDAVEAAAEAGNFEEASRLYHQAQSRQLQIEQGLVNKVNAVASNSSIGRASVAALSAGNKELARIMAPQLTPPAIHELARAAKTYTDEEHPQLPRRKKQ